MALSDGDAGEQKKAAAWIDKINRALNGEFDIEIDTKLATGASKVSESSGDVAMKIESDKDPMSIDRVASIKARIVSVYEKHNPSKIPDVDGLLQKYAGHEGKLLDAVLEKYNE